MITIEEAASNAQDTYDTYSVCTYSPSSDRPSRASFEDTIDFAPPDAIDEHWLEAPRPSSGRSPFKVITNSPAVVLVETTDPTRARYQRDIVRLLAGRPVESGACHPAERLIQQWVCDRGVAEFSAFWEEQVGTRPGFAADLLRCLSVVSPLELTAGWGHDLVELAFTSSSVDVRSAAVETLERWADERARRTLGMVKESVPWLRDYIQRVQRDLAE